MKRNWEPLYLHCSRGQAIGTWLGAVLNIVLVGWCASWLLLNARETSVSWPVLTALVVAGLFLGDLFTGFVHWGTDTWFDEVQLTRVVSIAREHHLFPHHIVGYGFRDYVGYTSWPAVLFFGPILPWLLVSEPSTLIFGSVLVCGEICVLSFFGTHFHRFGHRRSDNPLVRFLQRAHLLITPQYHSLHHEGTTHETHYCVVNGWANVVCDAIGFWRGLEKLVHRLTGAVPRHNDKEWLARFRRDRSFMNDPVPSLSQLRRDESPSSLG